MSDEKLSVVSTLLQRLRKRTDHELVQAAMASKGDVTKVTNYDVLKECLARLATIDAGSGSLGKGLRVARDAEEALRRNRPVFQAAFGPQGSEASRLVYAAAVVALWHTTTMLCAQAVDFTPDSAGRYTPVANRAGAAAVAASMPVTRLEKMVEQFGKNGFKDLVTERAALVEREALSEEFGTILTGIGLAVTGLAALLFLARDVVEWVYSLRGNTSRWLETQARFLDMNAASLGSDKTATRAKQAEYAQRLRALSDRVRVDAADAERETVRSIEASDSAPRIHSAPGGAAGGADLL